MAAKIDFNLIVSLQYANTPSAPTGYNKNNNFDNRRISRTCVLGAQKELSHRSTSFEYLKHTFTIEGKQPKPRFGCIEGPSHRDGSFKHPNRMFSLK